MKTIIVQQSDDDAWMTQAMHLACALARNTGGHLVLLRLVLANNPGLLGWGIAPQTTKEQKQATLCAAIAQDYGVDVSIQTMHFLTTIDALAQAAQQLNAVALFAHIADSRFPLWRRFRLWSLERQLHGCHLYPLDENLVPTSRGYLVPITTRNHRRALK